MADFSNFEAAGQFSPDVNGMGSEPNISGVLSMVGSVYSCRICGDFRTQSALTFSRHLQLAHSFESGEKSPAPESSSGGPIVCKYCGVVIRGRVRNLRIHCQTHGVSLTDYLARYYPKVKLKKKKNFNPEKMPLPAQNIPEIKHESVPETVNCRICGQGVIKHHRIIKDHVQNHGMSVKDYLLQYYQSEQTVKPIKCDESEGDPDSNPIQEPDPTSEPVLRVQKMKKKRISKDLEDAEVPEEFRVPGVGGRHVNYGLGHIKWASGCTYFCKICKFTTRYSSGVTKHLQNVHKMSVANYRKLHGPVQIETTKMTCQICKKSLTKDPGSLGKHFRAHGTSLVNYFIKYVQGKESEEEIRTEETTQENDGNDKAAEENDEKNEAVEEKAKDRSWMDKCVFACQICKDDQKFQSVKSYCSHMARVHHEKVRSLKDVLDTPCIVKRLFKCVMCNNKVIHEKIMVTRHLSGHQIQPEHYYKTFKAKH